MIKEYNRNTATKAVLNEMNKEIKINDYDISDNCIFISILSELIILAGDRSFVLKTNYYDDCTNRNCFMFLVDPNDAMILNGNIKEWVKSHLSLKNIYEISDQQVISVIFVNDDKTVIDGESNPLSLKIRHHESVIDIHVLYENQLYSEAYIRNMLSLFKNHLISSVEMRQSDISVSCEYVDEINRNNACSGLNGYNNILERFGVIVEKYGSKIAVQGKGRTLSYRELDDKANIVARRILEKVKDSNQRNICVYLDRSVEQIIVFLGIIKAGHCYVPFEPSNEEMRLEYVLEDAEIPLIISRDEFSNKIPKKIDVLKIDNIFACGSEESLNIIKKDMLAYANYTSGSTGRPKGVMITHKGVLRLALNKKGYSIDCDDVVMHASPTSFDATTFEVWSTLLNGGTIVVISKEELLNVDLLKVVIDKYKVTAMFITTSLFNKIVDIDVNVFGNLRLLLTGGDIASKDRFKIFKENNKNVDLVHVYGPTENTTFSTYYIVNEIDEENNDIPIGKPIDNSTVYIVDSNDKMVPRYVLGQILVGGYGIAQKYINNKVLTDDRFSEKIMVHDRVYKTGDYGYFDENMDIHFCGRKDRQVKVRGFRIELGDIEWTLLKNQFVKDCVVVLKESEIGKKITLYYVGDIDETEARAFLKANLANYMIPHSIIRLDEIPLNLNGKIFISELKKCNDNDDKGDTKGSIKEIVLKIFKKVLDTNELDVSSNYFDIGLDSLALMTILNDLKKEISEKLDIATLLNNPSIDKLIVFLESEISKL